MIQLKTFLIRSTAQAIHANDGPCKAVWPNGLTGAGTHLYLHQICDHTKMSATAVQIDDVAQPVLSTPDKTAIKYSDLFDFQCDTKEMMDGTEYFNLLVCSFKSQHQPVPCSMSYLRHTVSLSDFIYLPF